MAQLIAVDFHCKYQKVMWLDSQTGETGEADVAHGQLEEVKRFYTQFAPQSTVGMEVSGYSFWFEQLIEELGLELKVAATGEVARQRRRRQKNDRRDAALLLELLAQKEFPEVWRPAPHAREQRILIRHTVRLSREKTRWTNVLRALVYNYNLRIKAGTLSKISRQKIRTLEITPRLSQLRDELLERVERLESRITLGKAELKQWAQENPASRQLLTIPSIGPTTALYLALTVGPIERFATSKKLVAYVGLDSVEYSSDNLHKTRRYGAISKQGDRTLRWLLIQCANNASRYHPQLRGFYYRLLNRKPWGIVRTAVARKLLVCAYVLLRDGIDYAEYVRRGA